MELREEILARLALLTHAAWEEGLPPVLSRIAFNRLTASGALENLVLRRNAMVDDTRYERVCLLLSRVGRIEKELEAMEESGYRILLPQQALWPDGLRRLDKAMPQFLVMRGNSDLLRQSRIAVAGSRDILANTRRLAQETGRRIAQEGFVMICGGARGVDDAAQEACLAAGGSLILVPAQPVSVLLSRHAYLRTALDGGRLLVLCDTLPQEPFSAHKALSRNHTIYALGDAAVVVASRLEQGGSWRGAMDCIKGGYTPVYTFDMPWTDMQGNHALRDCGAAYLNPALPLGSQIHTKREEQLSFLNKDSVEAERGNQT